MRIVSCLSGLMFVFVFYTSNSFVYAQHSVWPQPDAEWGMCRFVANPTDYDEYIVSTPIRYDKDTLINTTTYQITRKFNTFNQLEIEYITRFNQDTIFRYVNGNEYMFFTYNVTIGDTLFPLRTGVGDYNQDTCSYTLELLCLDISPVNIDGNVLNLYEFVDVGNSIYGVNGSSGGPSKFYWIEIIGWVDWFPWLIQPSEGLCNALEFDGGGEFPIHYSDSNRSWSIEFPNGRVCDTLLSVEQEHFEQISIYPNPANKGQLIYIDGLESNSRIEIINTVGEIQRFNRINSNQIDITHLSDGLYFIKLFDNSNQLYKTVKLLIL